ncbi:alanine acetyl transferase-like protein [Salinisphaera sp. PC39]
MADAQALFDAYTSDPQVPKYMVWAPHTNVSETETFLEGCVADWNEGSRFAYALTLQGRASSPVGMLDATPKGHMLDIGYVLARDLWGRGLMTEAVMAFSELALALPGVFRLQASCDFENMASARTLEKSGFVREGRLDRYTVHPNISVEPRPCFMYARCR